MPCMNDIPREEQSYKKLYPTLNPKRELIIKSSECIQSAHAPRQRDFNDIEYNMDTADCAFLKSAKMEHINPLIFELIMDRLEKEWYWLRQSLVNTYNVPFRITELACNICGFESSEANDQLIYCDGCNVCVHQECYGVPYVPENAWFCKKCLFCDDAEPPCKYCTEVGGAYKQTADRKWAHVLCCLYNEHLTFGNTVFLEPIEDPERKNILGSKPQCIICKQTRGLSINCKVENCPNFYHVTCAVQHSFYMDTANFITYCGDHDPRNKFKTLINELEGNLSDNKDKNHNENIGIKNKNIGINNTHNINTDEIVYPVLKEIPKPRNNVKLTNLQVSYILKMKNAKPRPLSFFVDRILCNDLCKFNFKNKIQFVKDVVVYWASKKERAGLGLELNLNKTDGIEWFEERSYLCIPSDWMQEFYDQCQNKDDGNKKIISFEAARKENIHFENPTLNFNTYKSSSKKDSQTKEYHQFIAEIKAKCTHMKIQSPSIDLLLLFRPLLNMRKQVYLYLMLSQKRRQYFKLMVKMHSFVYNRDLFVMDRIVDNLLTNSRFYMFHFPVNESIAPGYFEIIKNPMDLSTMKRKIERASTIAFSTEEKNNKSDPTVSSANKNISTTASDRNTEDYSLQEFRSDLSLIVNNCREFNKGVPNLMRLATELNNRAREYQSQYERLLYDEIDLSSYKNDLWFKNKLV